jgi:hypothetical protein
MIILKFVLPRRNSGKGISISRQNSIDKYLTYALRCRHIAPSNATAILTDKFPKAAQVYHNYRKYKQ